METNKNNNELPFKINQKVKIFKRGENEDDRWQEYGRGIVRGYSFDRGNNPRYIYYTDLDWVKDGIDYQELVCINAPRIYVKVW